MSVTLRVDDLVQPGGELANSFFPDADLDEKLDGWLERAATRVEANGNISSANQDSAAALLVYHYAYSYIANRLAAMPNSTAVNGGDVTVAYAKDRLDYWQSKADSKLTAYDILAVTPAAATSSPQSMTIFVNPIW